MRNSFRLAAVWAVAALALASAKSATAQERIRDVVYGHKHGVAITMDIFTPAKPNGIGVIWMVSGGWFSNHDSINVEIGKAFTDRGATVFQVVHGSRPKFTLTEIVADIDRSVRFIRTNAAKYGVDPDRLGISGGSAGGHLSLMMAAFGKEGDPNAKDPIMRASSKVQAVACFFPPTDFLNYGNEGVSALSFPLLKPYWPVFDIPTDATDAVKNEIGKKFSPIYGFTKETCPILIIHGDADPLVPIQQSKIVMTKLEELMVPHKLVVREGKAHGWTGIEKDIPILAEWLEKYLPKK